VRSLQYVASETHNIGAIMKQLLLCIAIAALAAGCDKGGGGSAKQGPQSPPTQSAGTKSPGPPPSADKPVGATSNTGTPAQAERGSGVEGTNSGGTTSGNQQPLSTGGTSR
jgi:hypothetical protein